MKKRCAEYFETENIWKECLFILDANVLIKIHDADEKNRKKWFSILEKVKNRVWVPHQFAIEYLDYQNSKTRRRVTKAKAAIKGQFDQIEKNLKDLEWLSDSNFKSLLAHLEKTNKAVSSDLDALESATPISAAKDPIRNEFVDFFEGRVGAAYSSARTLEILEEGEVRSRNQIPPGFTDAGKAANRFGDLFGWMQIIDEISVRKIPAIFVTLERKPDWWKLVDGEPVMARPELSREFQAKTTQKFSMVSFQEFIKWVATEFEMESKAVSQAIESAKSAVPMRSFFINTNFAQTSYALPNVSLTQQLVELAQQITAQRQRVYGMYDAELNKFVPLPEFSEIIEPILPPAPEDKKKEQK